MLFTTVHFLLLIKQGPRKMGGPRNLGQSLTAVFVFII